MIRTDKKTGKRKRVGFRTHHTCRGAVDRHLVADRDLRRLLAHVPTPESDRAARRRLVWLLLTRGDVGAEALRTDGLPALAVGSDAACPARCAAAAPRCSAPRGARCGRPRGERAAVSARRAARERGSSSSWTAEAEAILGDPRGVAAPGRDNPSLGTARCVAWKRRAAGRLLRRRLRPQRQGQLEARFGASSCSPNSSRSGASR